MARIVREVRLGREELAASKLPRAGTGTGAKLTARELMDLALSVGTWHYKAGNASEQHGGYEGTVDVSGTAVSVELRQLYALSGKPGVRGESHNYGMVAFTANGVLNSLEELPERIRKELRDLYQTLDRKHRMVLSGISRDESDAVLGMERDLGQVRSFLAARRQE